METKIFNFNNEVDTFEIKVDKETGRVVVPGEGGEVLAEYASVQQFAEIYAQARDVRPDNLKNWMIVENGDVISFVLRAGTAGISVNEVRGTLNEILNDMAAGGVYHPLDVRRVQQELEADGADIVNALALSSVPEVAKVVYDRLEELGAFTEGRDEPEEEADTRSDMEIFLDRVMEEDETLAFFANLVGLPADAEKEEILTALDQSPVPYTTEMLRTLYNDALRETIEQGIGVNTAFEALLVMTQSVPGQPSAMAKNQMITAAAMARRDKVNVTEYTVGHRHIRKGAKLLGADSLADAAIYVVGSTPITVDFDEDIDEVLEEEVRREQEAAGEEGVVPYNEEDDFEDEDYDEDDYEF